MHLPSAGDAGAPELGVVPSVAVAVAGEPGAVGVLGPFGVPFEGAITAEGSAGCSPGPPHATRAAKEANNVTIVSAFRMALR